MTEHAAVVESTHTARKRIDELGPEAAAAVEELRAELERTPGLGRRVRVLTDRAEVWVTRIEPRSGLPALSVTYVQIQHPPPPTGAIVSVVPDDGAAENA
ncbi:hypothetical protein AMK26_25925 [Streptomyces sp. CB03234]|uniref:hypothetical protein n=1 Tax=Streptomyces sp. (strain CB03234) TaxID=1703937 RepID=UPI0009394C86|nr:hypothetical protein [Streptomyces sp. CB03234]OKJ99480.1 hypothetical protein AMK26_25925 [Streptomyces sp. CB03234]